MNKDHQDRLSRAKLKAKVQEELVKIVVTEKDNEKLGHAVDAIVAELRAAAFDDVKSVNAAQQASFEKVVASLTNLKDEIDKGSFKEDAQKIVTALEALDLKPQITVKQDKVELPKDLATNKAIAVLSSGITQMSEFLGKKIQEGNALVGDTQNKPKEQWTNIRRVVKRGNVYMYDDSDWSATAGGGGGSSSSGGVASSVSISNTPLDVNITGGSSAGTEYTEDAAAAANPAGGMTMFRRKDTLSSSEVSTDGDNIAANATSKGELYVKQTDNVPVLNANLEVSFTTTIVAAVGTTDVASYRWVSVHIVTQGGSSTVTFQGSNDNTNWVSVALQTANNVGGVSAATSTTSAGTIMAGPLNYRYFRLNVTGIASGTTAGVIEFSAVPSTVAMPQGNTNQTVNVNQIAGTSTAAGHGTAANAIRVELPTDGTGVVGVAGTVADAASESGNPVTVSGIYESTLPTYTTGQRGRLHVDAKGALIQTIESTSAHVPGDANGNSINTPRDSAGNGMTYMMRAWLYNGSTWDRQPGTTAGTYGIVRDAAGNARGANVNASNELNVALSSVPSHAVTNAGTFAVQATEADGANSTLGAKADAKSTATDTTAITVMSVLKQISASVQAPPSQAVTNAGTFAVQAAQTGAWTTTQTPTTSGGLSIFNATSGDGSTALTNSAQQIKGTAGQLFGWYIYNPNSSVAYVPIYNVASASVTVGTTNPAMVLAIPATSAANLELVNGLAFGTAISIAAATTAAGNSAPATALDANFWYK